MRKGIMILTIAGLPLLAGCGGGWENKPYVNPESKLTLPYRLALDNRVPERNPAGVTLPVIDYTANPEALERRAVLVVRFDASGAKNDQPAKDRLILLPTDVPGASGTLQANYMDLADQKLAKQLAGYCIKGTVKLTVALVRSSIKPDADEKEIDARRLSAWLPIEVDFENPNPHPKC